MIDDFNPDANPDPNAKPVEFPAASPKRMAPPPEVNPSGEYMGVNQARQAAIMRAGYTPARAAGGPRPAETTSSTNTYQDTSAVRAAQSTSAAYNQTSFGAGEDIELADMTTSSSTTKQPGGGGGGVGGNRGAGNQGVGGGAGEKGFWTTGRIIFAVVAGVIGIGVISVVIAAVLGAFKGDSSGGGGGGGGTAEKKPPAAKPVKLTNQQAGKVEIDILNGKDPNGDSWVVAGDGTLAGSGVKLLIGMESKTSHKAAGEGDWTVDAATGKISFTPLATFTGSPTPVNYFVVDSNNMQSGNASISIAYAPVVVNPPPSTSPTVSDIALADQVPGKITVDILGGKDAAGKAFVTKGSGALKGNGVFLVSNEGIAQKLPVTGEGEWLVDMTTGTIGFTPDADFMRAPTPVRFLVRDDSNPPLKSNEGRITVSFKAGPVAVSDVDGSFVRLQPTDTVSVTVDILANDKATAAAIDPKSVLLSRAIATDPSYMPMTTIAADGKSADVSGEGKWTVDPLTGKMTFDALPGFNGQTTIVAYTVADINGIRSNEAWVQLNSEIKTATDALQKLVSGSDSDFWAAYKKLVIDDAAVSIREALVVTSLFADVTYRSLAASTRLKVDGNGLPTNPGIRVLGAEFSRYEMQWLNAKATKDALWTIMQTVQADRYRNYPEAANKGAVRYACLDVMTRLLRVVVASMNKMQQ